MLKKAIGEFSVAASYFINADYKPSLELLQHQYNI
jgi:hypothetical protein